MTIAANLGYPRIGPRRELKTALEAFWAGKTDEAELLAAAAALRAGAARRPAGRRHQPCALGRLRPLRPCAGDGLRLRRGAARLRLVRRGSGLARHPVRARARRARHARRSAPPASRAARAALEMTKWFDTNYHYLVPRLSAGTRFRLLTTAGPPRCARGWQQARARARCCSARSPSCCCPRPRTARGRSTCCRRCCRPMPTRCAAWPRRARPGCRWTSPAWSTDLPAGADDAYARRLPRAGRGGAGAGPPARHLLRRLAREPAARRLAARRRTASRPGARAGAARRALERVAAGPLALARRGGWAQCLAHGPARRRSRGCSAARRRADGARAADGRALLLAAARAAQLAPETALDPALQRGASPSRTRSWPRWRRSPARLDEGETAVGAGAGGERRGAGRTPRRCAAARSGRGRAARRGDAGDGTARAAPIRSARPSSATRLRLPPLPVTTIGSFPQTAEVRRAARPRSRAARSTAAEYDAEIERLTAEAVRWQEEIGVDVPVHGEFERNDMVKYFGEQLAGYAFTKHGWVQSYGSRCVAPPIIWARRLAPGADDGALVRLCAVADPTAR